MEVYAQKINQIREDIIGNKQISLDTVIEILECFDVVAKCLNGKTSENACLKEFITQHGYQEQFEKYAGHTLDEQCTCEDHK